jgi:hypothetical protein
MRATRLVDSSFRAPHLPDDAGTRLCLGRTILRSILHRFAQARACFRSGEIRVLDASGKLERTIAFNETGRKLWPLDDVGPIDGLLELEEGKLRATLIKAVVKATLRAEKVA